MTGEPSIDETNSRVQKTRQDSCVDFVYFLANVCPFFAQPNNTNNNREVVRRHKNDIGFGEPREILILHK